MPMFSEALERFKEDGCFRLEAALLSTEQIKELEFSVTFLRENRPEIPSYEFHLSQVQFIPDPFPRLEQAVDGILVEQHTQHEECLLNSDIVSLNNAKSLLSCLLNQIDTWSSIKIDRVFFSAKNETGERSNDLKIDFCNYLLNSLAEHMGTSLNEFSLTPFSLSKNLPALAYFLARRTSLRILHLDITKENQRNWLMLSEVLAAHPNINYLDFGNTPFDENAATALSKLLSENYRIAKITIAAPHGNWILVDAYHQINQRLSIPYRLRFKEERLSLEALLTLTFQTLTEIKRNNLKKQIDPQKNTLLMKRISFLLSNQGTLAINDAEKEQWLKEAYVLPAVYYHNKEYMKEFSSFVQLPLDRLVPGGSNTVGYLLLERALEVKNTNIIQCLLESNANLFEPPPEHIKKPFLVRLFEVDGPLEEWVIHYLKKDLNLLVPAVKILSPYLGVGSICNSLKEHLTIYCSISENSKKQSALSCLLNRVMSHFQDNQGACTQNFHNLVWYTKAATDDTVNKNVAYGSLFEAQKILEHIVRNSKQTHRGFWGSSKLHDDLLRFGKELHSQLALQQETCQSPKLTPLV